MSYRRRYSFHFITRNLVGVEGFEPPTSCSQSRRATRLRYTPKKHSSTPATRKGGNDTRRGHLRQWTWHLRAREKITYDFRIPSSRHLWTILNRKILELAGLVLRFCSIGLSQSNPNLSASKLIHILDVDPSRLAALQKLERYLYSGVFTPCQASASAPKM